MNVQSAQPAPAPPLTGRGLTLAQIAWVVVLLTFVMFVAGVVVYYDGLRRGCTAPPEQCQGFDYATPAEAAQLAASGMSLGAYALWRAGFRVAFAIIPITRSISASLNSPRSGM